MICKKCIKKGTLEGYKEVSEKKCKKCKQKFNSRFLNVCSECQYKYKDTLCLACGLVIDNNMETSKIKGGV